MESIGQAIAVAISQRALVLELALLAALLLGPWLIRLVLPMARAYARLLDRLGNKLNRSRRDAATRAWRGAIITLTAMTLAMLLGALLAGFGAVASGILLVLIFAHGLYPAMFRYWRASRAKAMTSQLDYPPYLFADTHALIRYLVLEHATRFAVHLVGTAFWFGLLGLAGALGYLALAVAAAHYSPQAERNLAFGGVSAQLFAFADALPRHIAIVLLLLAGVFVPGCRPRPAFRHHGNWPHFLATLLDLALGGPMPTASGVRDIGWVGEGTPKPDAAHLTRWLLVWAVALLILAGVILPLVIAL